MSAISLKSVYAPAPNTERSKPTRITHTPKANEIVYASGNSIIVRSITDPMVVDVYTGHRAKCTVARYAPSGNYCASADMQGNVMVWDTLNKVERIVKYQKKCFAAGVLDLDWSEDSKRICVVGNGKDVKSEVWNWDSGSSAGDLTGHTSNVVGCAIRPVRPYRLVTVGEDNLVNFYKGPPFRYDHTVRDHTRFVNTVEYSPDGSVFVTGSSDKKIFLYDGVEGTKKAEFGAGGGGHTLSVLSLAFALDGKTLFSCSTDKTGRHWDVETQQLLQTFSVRKTPDLYDQLVGCTYTVAGVVAATLRGDLCLFDPRVADKGTFPVMTLRGHKAPIQSLHVVHHELKGAGAVACTEEEDRCVDFVTTSFDGQVLEFNKKKGALPGTVGFTHETQPLVSAVSSAGTLVSVGMDAKIAFAESQSRAAPTEPPAAPVKVAFENPRGVAVLCEGRFVVSIAPKKIAVWNCSAVAGEVSAPVVQKETTGFDATCVATHEKSGLIVIGGSDQFVHFWRFDPEAKTLEEFGKSKGKYPGVVASVCVSKCGTRFAAARDRYVCIGTVGATDAEIALDESRLLHTSRVTAVDFTEDAAFLLSAGLDCQVFVWDTKDTEKFTKFVSCHAPLGVTAAKWIAAGEFLTTGSDGIVRSWEWK